jgi:hypothetical protein
MTKVLLDTDKAAVIGAVSGATVTDAGTPASDDKVLIQDTSDSDNLKYVNVSDLPAQDISGKANIASPTFTGTVVLPDGQALVTPALGTPASGVLTNATGLPVGGIADGTDGELITWDASGEAAVVAAGTDTQVLTSNGAGAAPTFQDAGGGGGGVVIETTTGVTHSLVTTSGQVVVVWAKGSHTGSSGLQTIYLKYNGVTKDSVQSRQERSWQYNPFSLMYTETPGAGTNDVTVTTPFSTIEDVVIIIQIIG